MKKEFDLVGFWAQKCRENRTRCQEEVNRFTDAQIKNANAFYKCLVATKAGFSKAQEY